MGLDPKENHVAICFLRKAGTDGPPLEVIGHSCIQNYHFGRYIVGYTSEI